MSIRSIQTTATSRVSSRAETLLLSTSAAGCVIGVLLLTGDWPARAAHFGDNDAFVSVAVALRTGNYAEVAPTAFWGLPYVVALISAITPLDELHALWLCSWVAALGTVWLAFDLWGAAVATWFGIANYAWLQRAALGGAEPLFMLFVLLAFVAARRERIGLSALAAALATVVRPVGVIALLVLGLILLVRRAWWRLATAVGIALVVAVAYCVPLGIIYGDPLINVHWYSQGDWRGHAAPIALPFVPIVRGYLTAGTPMTNTWKVGVWLVVVVIGCVAFFVRSARRFARERLVELGFAIGGLAFVLCYDAPSWTWIEFPRFAIPIVPFALIGLEPWLPLRRAILWPAAGVSGIFAGMSAVNVRHAIELLRQWIGL